VDGQLVREDGRWCSDGRSCISSNQLDPSRPFRHQGSWLLSSRKWRVGAGGRAFGREGKYLLPCCWVAGVEKGISGELLCGGTVCGEAVLETSLTCLKSGQVSTGISKTLKDLVSDKSLPSYAKAGIPDSDMEISRQSRQRERYGKAFIGFFVHVSIPKHCGYRCRGFSSCTISIP
jgi:hypothetical protein